jgi:hypothetical protein
MTVDDFTFSPDSEMLSGDPLGSHPLCAEVAAAVVWPQKPWRDRMLGKAGDFLLIETVPAMIRKRLRLESKSDKNFGESGASGISDTTKVVNVSSRKLSC